MQLEDYFNFLTPNDIRLKNSRIGIETILYEYIYRARTPEEIGQIYPTITLEQIHATILYYLHEKDQVSQYLADWLEHCQKGEQQQDINPPAFVEKMRKLKAERGAEVENLNEYSLQTEKITPAEVGRILNLPSRWAVDALLKQHNADLHYDEVDLERDRETLRQFRAKHTSSAVTSRLTNYR